MDTKDWLFLLAAVLSPILAAWLSLVWQNRRRRQDAKEHLFLSLMAHRRSHVPNPELVNALNLIDVIFADHTKVVDLWHRYYEELHHTNDPNRTQAREHTYLQLLSAMAQALGYTRLEQTDIDKFYEPQTYSNQSDLNWRCQIEWLRVLENSAKLQTDPRQLTIPGLDDVKPQ